MVDTPSVAGAVGTGDSRAQQAEQTIARLPRDVGMFDLYTEGGIVHVGPEDSGFDVWMQKLSGPEHEKCIRAGAAKKAEIEAAINETTDEEWQVAVGEMLDVLHLDVFDENDAEMKRSLAELSFGERIATAQDEASTKLMMDPDLADPKDPDSAQNRWAKDGYILGLTAQFTGDPSANVEGLYIAWAAHPDPEGPLVGGFDRETVRKAHQVYSELEAYLAEEDTVREAAKAKIVDAEVARHTTADLRERAVRMFLRNRAQEMWLRTFHEWRTYLSCRLASNHDVRHFDVPGNGKKVPKLDENGEVIVRLTDDGPEIEMIELLKLDAVRALPDIVKAQLKEGYDQIGLTRAEGNALPPAPSSSPPSSPTEVVRSMLSGRPATPSSPSPGTS